MGSRTEVTVLLQQLADGRADAAERLWPLVYDELRRLADRYLKDEPKDHTLQPTALVNEAYLSLAGSEAHEWEGRAHFFGVAARAMRRILIDHARRRRSAKRGGQFKRIPLMERARLPLLEDDRLIALDEALTRLNRIDPRLAKLVELRFFGGLNFDQAARLLEVAPITAKRMWKMAKGWLNREIQEVE